MKRHKPVTWAGDSYLEEVTLMADKGKGKKGKPKSKPKGKKKKPAGKPSG
jgi:hypothetical protein